MRHRFVLFRSTPAGATSSSLKKEIEGIAVALRVRSTRHSPKFKLIRFVRTLLYFACTAFAQDISFAAESAANEDIALTTQSLQQLRVDRQSPEIPAEVRPLLTKLKHQLRDLIGATLNSHASGTDNLARMRKILLEELAKHPLAYETPEIVTISDDDGEPDFTYGRLQQIAIDKPTDHPELIAVTISLSVVCGTDTSLYVFKKQKDRWPLAIAQEASDYEEISGAQGEFQYAISPPGSDGGFYVVTKNVNPWCSSNWQTIRYQTMREGSSPMQPKILLQREEPIFLGNGNSGWVSISPSGFKLEFDARQEFGEIVRRHIAAYEVAEDSVRRIPPFAHTPEDFLDEWFSLPWNEASKWINPSASKTLHRLHTQIRAQRTDDQQPVFTEFVFDPAACRIRPGKWQIGIDVAPASEDSHVTGKRLRQFFTITQNNGRFSLQNTSKASLPKCRLLQARSK